MIVRRNAEKRALCLFHGENRGSIPLGRANVINNLYQIPEAVTRGGFPNRRLFDSTWRTKEVRHAYTAPG